MGTVTIRKFEHTDVDAFIRLSKSSFADEWLAEGMTPEDFEQETRRIFRWKMIPYKLLTALMGVKWEAFVAEENGKVVGGGMYMGRNNRMTITNLMVEPAYRRQGIGQALLKKRLERLSERGFPFVTVQVLEKNQPSLGNLKKQDFEVFNQYSVYERTLPLPVSDNALQITVRELNASDKVLFDEIEQRTTSPFILKINGGLGTQYFPSGWQKLYSRFIGYHKWLKAFELQGKTIGFLGAGFQDKQRKGYLLQPVIDDEEQSYLPAMIQKAGEWLKEAGKESIILEIPDWRSRVREYLLGNGWNKLYTWLELVKWLDERTRQKYSQGA